MIRHALRTGEYLAIDPTAIRHDAEGFFILLGSAPRENKQVGTVCIVHVRGALMHYKGEGGDSYEAILERVGLAVAADPKPTAVVFRIESPGGVVAGLNECVTKLQRMSKDSGVPFVAYVDEMAASAAYAMCCACSEILAPPSAIIGSVGVISTMVSQVEADKKLGVTYRIITSGKRKADGHPHAPITEDAVKAETARNAQLASQFFALAGKARGMSSKKLQSLEAAIYLGADAERVGLIDDVETLDNVLFGLDATETEPPETVAPNAGNVTDRRAKETPESNELDNGGKTRSLSSTAVTGNVTPSEDAMPVKLDALIKTTEAAIAAETDPKKLRPLQAKLAAFAATRAEMDDDKGPPKKDDDKGDEDDDDDESEAAKHAENARKMKAKAEAMKHRARASEFKKKAAEAEEEAKRCDEEAKGAEDDEEEEAHLRVTHPVASAPAGADPTIVALFAEVARLGKEQAKIKAGTEDAERADLVARASKYVPKHLLKPLTDTANLPTLRAMVAEAEKGSPMIVSDSGDLVMPKHRPASSGPESALSADTLRMIDDAVTHCGAADPKAFREKLVNEHLKALNGARS
jgi:signal peptide peptidase SppA